MTLSFWLSLAGYAGLSIVGSVVGCWGLKKLYDIAFRGRPPADGTPENDADIKRRINESEAIRALAHRRLMDHNRRVT